MADIRKAALALEVTTCTRVAAAASGAQYDVTVERDVAAFAPRLAAAQAATVFQSGTFLRAWYATIGEATGEPLLVGVTDRRTGALAALLPLLRHARGGTRIVTFPDHDVSDSNAPLLGPTAPVTAADAQAMWQAVRRALDADLVRFTKMPAEIEGRVNPLTLLRQARASALTGNVLIAPGTWDGYLASLRGMFRKQMRKSWRLFAQHEGARFRRITGAAEAARVFDALARQQSARMHAQGQPYQLDEPEFAAFYSRLVAEGIADGSVVLTALMRGETVVAALLGLTRRNSYVMIRVGSDPAWSHCSPGRLVIVRTLEMLHEEGFRAFDFSVGRYAYKRRLGAQPRPLYDLTDALAPRGVPLLAADRARQFVRARPALHALARRFARPAGKPAQDDDHD